MSESPMSNSEPGPEDLRSENKKKNEELLQKQPTNESELQLYRVLQRANLLSYFDVFINQGGDDVQQLCEAGEDEFLEIMSLVGMASKPLHVRRLQKALQEWVQNPALFRTPLIPIQGRHSSSEMSPSVISFRGIHGSVSHALDRRQSSPSIGAIVMPSLVSNSLMESQMSQSNFTHSTPNSPSPLLQPSFSKSPSPNVHQIKQIQDGDFKMVRSSVEDKSITEPYIDDEENKSSQLKNQSFDHKRRLPSEELNWDQNVEMDELPGPSSSPLQLTPTLDESQIQKIANTASELVKSLPDLEPKTPNVKKKICKELEVVITMPDTDSRKMDEIRKFSAIYGRFDCKRNPEKPLTLHEVSVNEAAAQICHLLPAMLTRREELFPLARQVVRDSGYQYSKGHSRSTFSLSNKMFNNEESWINKKMRMSDGSEMTPQKRGRLDQISEEYHMVSDRLEQLRGAAFQARIAGEIASLQQLSHQMELCQAKLTQLLQEREGYIQLIRPITNPPTDVEDNTSQRSYSSNNSPSTSEQETVGPIYEKEDATQNEKILSASGGQIIAVENPALSIAESVRKSPHLPLSITPGVKQEPRTPPPSS